VAAIAAKFQFSAEEMRNQWDAYALTNSLTDVTTTHLQKLEWSLNLTRESQHASTSDAMDLDRHSLACVSIACDME